MQYDCDTFAELLTEHGQTALRRAVDVPEGLAGITALRRDFPPALATLAHLTVTLRRRAADRFSRASAMFFLPEALEQATGEIVATHKATRFEGCRRIADLGCGIGGDTIALAGVASVIAVDRDALRLAMARENVAVYQRADRVTFEHARVAAFDADAFHIDPARRKHGSRVYSVDDFAPPPAVIRSILERCPDGGICIGPMTANDDAFGPCEVEVISSRGAVRAMTLWFGRFATAARRATSLDTGSTLIGSGELAGAADCGPLGAFIALPDPAAVRARLVKRVAEEAGARFLDPRIAVLTLDDPDGGTEWTRCYPVHAAFPFSRARCHRELSARGIECVIVSLHGVSVASRELARFSRGGPPAARLFVVRTDDGPLAVITDLRSGGTVEF